MPGLECTYDKAARIIIMINFSKLYNEEKYFCSLIFGCMCIEYCNNYFIFNITLSRWRFVIDSLLYFFSFINYLVCYVVKINH